MKEELLFKGKSESCDNETNVPKLDSKQPQMKKGNYFKRKSTDNESHWGMEFGTKPSHLAIVL